VGQNAAEIAIGMGAEVYVYDRSIDRLRELEIFLNGRCSTCYASTLEIESRLPDMDLVIGAVLVHGARAPRIITRQQLKLTKPGAVLVDVSIDQGGCLALRTRTRTRLRSIKPPVFGPPALQTSRDGWRHCRLGTEQGRLRPS
jgi:alanine dehydrogenase